MFRILVLISLFLLQIACQNKSTQHESDVITQDADRTTNTSSNVDNESGALSMSDLDKTKKKNDPKEVVKINGKVEQNKEVKKAKVKLVENQGFTSNPVGRATKIYKLKWKPGDALPSACSLLSKETIGLVFGIPPESILVKDGNPKSVDSRSCFFKWDDDSFPNTGILVQVLKNPVPEEVDDWPGYYVSNKKSLGETVVGEGAPTKFLTWDHIGNDGAFNYDIGKYYWRFNQDLVCMIAYNMIIKPDDQLRSANYFSTEISNNLLQ